MKKAVIVLLICFLLCGCSALPDKQRIEKTETAPQYIKGVWISYSEINSMLISGDFKTAFSTAVNKVKDLNVTDLFVHVRAFGDSLFKSDYYPINSKAEQYDFDVLEYMLVTCKSNGLRFHAWINPYRTTDGTYLNPADSLVLANIINGIREIIRSYKVDGIHFDDYFYPSADTDIDLKSYEDYCAGAESPLSLSEFRTANINTLISSVYTLIKFTDKNIIYSVSPAASIEKNKNEFFADVKAWCESGCVDMIIPQLYFGFKYEKEEYRFDNLLNAWKNIPRADGVLMVIGLASYKSGTDAEPDREEWQDGADILKRQAEICLDDSNIDGICYFSLTSFLNVSEQ